MVADIREKGRQAHEERVAVEAERQRVTGIRDAYLEEMRKTYLDYRKKRMAWRHRPRRVPET